MSSAIRDYRNESSNEIIDIFQEGVSDKESSVELYNKIAIFFLIPVFMLWLYGPE